MRAGLEDILSDLTGYAFPTAEATAGREISRVSRQTSLGSLMRSADFKRGIQRMLESCGFTRTGKSMRRSGSGVTTIVATEKGFGDQWFVVVGFWLEKLGGMAPDTVEHTHLYYRLERLVPQFRELILTAGALSDALQPNAFADLCQLLGGDIDATLRKLGTEDGLRSAMAAGNLDDGLVRKEARELLLG